MQDETDRSVIGAAKRAQVAAGDLVFSHGRSIDEPLLWLPDLVAGAVAARLLGDTRFTDRLRRLEVLGPFEP